MEQQIFGVSGEHFAKINIVGNSNTVDTSQKDSGNKILFTDITLGILTYCRSLKQ